MKHTVTLLDHEVTFTIDRDEHRIYRGTIPISQAEVTEFEEQILGKSITDASDEEIIAALDILAQKLSSWLKHKDDWFLWKKWAENL